MRYALPDAAVSVPRVHCAEDAGGSREAVERAGDRGRRPSADEHARAGVAGYGRGNGW